MTGERQGDEGGVIRQAREAQRAWAALPVGARRQALAPLGRRLRDRSDEAAQVVERERGTPSLGALAGEVLGAVDLIAHWQATIEDRLAVDELAPRTLRAPRKEGRASREARGVIALIGAAHEPIAGPLRTLVPALLAGNAVVVAPGAPACAALVLSLFDGLLPHGLLTTWTGDAVALAASAVDHVVCEAARSTAARVAAACAERLGTSTLTVVGEGAAVVMADADLARAARGVTWGAFGAPGPTGAARVVWVESAVADDLFARLSEQVAALRPGVDVPAGTTPAVRRWSPDEVPDAGALVVRAVGSVSEALAAVAAGSYDSLSLWTSDRPRGEMLTAHLPVALVGINTHGLADARPAAHEVGALTDALVTLTRPRVVLVDRSLLGPEPWWFPHGPALRTLVGSQLSLAVGGLAERWAARLLGRTRALGRQLEQRDPAPAVEPTAPAAGDSPPGEPPPGGPPAP